LRANAADEAQDRGTNQQRQHPNGYSNPLRGLVWHDDEIYPAEERKVYRTVGYKCHPLFSAETVLSCDKLISDDQENIARHNANEGDIDRLGARESEQAQSQV